MESAKKSLPSIKIIDSETWHVTLLRQNLRKDDANEILRFGISIERALWRSYRASVIRKTIFIDDKIAAMYGCMGSFLSDSGIPWLITTQEVYKVSPLKFTRIYQQNVEEMLRVFQSLENYVDSEYHAAIRMLDIVGFTISEPEEYGAKRSLYRKFRIGK